MNKEQLDALRKFAQEATPGPWEFWHGWVATDIDNDGGVVICHRPNRSGGKYQKQIDANFLHIAAANPSTILQLLDYIETLDKDAARWRYARQFLAIEDIEAWNSSEWKGHQPNESENIRSDEAIDAAMQGETK